MYRLTKEQYLSNLKEVLAAKEAKLEKLQTEVKNLKEKIQKVETKS